MFVYEKKLQYPVKIKGRLLSSVLRIGWREHMVLPCAILPKGGI